MDHEGSAKPEESAAAEESNAAVEETQELDSAELMGSVASELGIGGAVPPSKSESEESGEAEETADEETEEAETPETEGSEESGESEETEESAEAETEETEEAGETEDEIAEDEVKGLTEEGRAAVNKRIGKVVAQRNEARERAEALERQAAELQEQVDKPLRQQIAQVLGVDPMFTAQSEQDLSESEQHWWQVKQFTEQHMHREDGFTDEQSGQTFTQEQLRARHAQADEMLMRGLPQAKQLFEQRRQCMDTAKEAYPDLFKAGTPESRVRANALKSIPGLAQLPNADILIGDMIAGQKAREAAEAKNDKANTKVGSRKKPEKAKPAKVPVKPAPAKRSPVAKKVVEKGSDADLMGMVASELSI